MTAGGGPSQWAAELTESFRVLGVELQAAQGRPDAVLAALTQVAVERVTGAESAGITRATSRGYVSIAPTSELVSQVDEIQYLLKSGPCVDAASGSAVVVADDLRTDSRWPQFGKQAFAAAGVASMLSFRLYLEDEPDIKAALNLYSSVPAAFDDTSRNTALLLATHSAVLVSRAVARERVTNLELALQHGRTIGVAMGILMTHHKITRERAFDLLRIASQDAQRKLFGVAEDVVETGALPEIPGGRSTLPTHG